MTKFDKNPGATSFVETAIDQLGASQDNALMSSLSSNFAERRQRREAEAQARQEIGYGLILLLPCQHIFLAKNDPGILIPE